MPYIVTDSLVNAQPITLYDAGQMQRDWTYIDDIVAGLVGKGWWGKGVRNL